VFSPKYYFISGSGNKKTFSKKNLSKISNSLKKEQNKYKISLCGGDTTFSNQLSFSITSIGYSKNIVYRNKAKINDDIYVTGNLGDSFVGLKILQNKIKVTKKLKSYFIKKYFEPDIQIKLTNELLKFANSSIDISDGLLDDLKKMINNQKLSYEIWEEKVPISRNLQSYIKNNNYKKSNFISNGDDYQILFTASDDKSRIIKNTSKKLGVKISRIGKIRPYNQKSLFIGEKGQHLLIKNSGYKHQF
jgi:thiamine-monophosphate kinase